MGQSSHRPLGLTDRATTPSRKGWLTAEFGLLYLGIPLAIALFLPRGMLFPALFAFTICGLIVLALTGYNWRGISHGWGKVRWGVVALFGLLVGVVGAAIMAMLSGQGIPAPTPARLRFLAVLWLLYPLLSALPQELIFRTLFFHRYRTLLPDPRHAVLLNAAIFSFAHLMYWSVVVMVLTFVGGLIFARAYQKYGFPMVWMLHAVAGNMLFSVGMGWYFWSGNVVRPF